MGLQTSTCGGLTVKVQCFSVCLVSISGTPTASGPQLATQLAGVELIGRSGRHIRARNLAEVKWPQHATTAAGLAKCLAIPIHRSLTEPLPGAIGLPGQKTGTKALCFYYLSIAQACKLAIDLAENSLGRVECTTRIWGVAGIVSVTMPLFYV